MTQPWGQGPDFETVKDFTCEGCGDKLTASANEAFSQGWDTKPYFNGYTKCSKCPITKTVWWQLLMEAKKARKKAIIVDIDGTVAHRVDRDWFEYDKAHTDAPDHAIIEIIKTLWNSNYHIIFVSGRNEDSMDVTAKWLNIHCPPYAKLLMRNSKDFREDSIVKRELYEEHIKPHYDVLCVFDDRNQVVDMWREIGLKCLQVQPGNF